MKRCLFLGLLFAQLQVLYSSTYSPKEDFTKQIKENARIVFNQNDEQFLQIKFSYFDKLMSLPIQETPLIEPKRDRVSLLEHLKAGWMIPCSFFAGAAAYFLDSKSKWPKQAAFSASFGLFFTGCIRYKRRIGSLKKEKEKKYENDLVQWDLQRVRRSIAKDINDGILTEMGPFKDVYEKGEIYVVYHINSTRRYGHRYSRLADWTNKYPNFFNNKKTSSVFVEEEPSDFPTKEECREFLTTAVLDLTGLKSYFTEHYERRPQSTHEVGTRNYLINGMYMQHYEEAFRRYGEDTTFFGKLIEFCNAVISAAEAIGEKEPKFRERIIRNNPYLSSYLKKIFYEEREHYFSDNMSRRSSVSSDSSSSSADEDSAIEAEFSSSSSSTSSSSSFSVPSVINDDRTIDEFISGYLGLSPDISNEFPNPDSMSRRSSSSSGSSSSSADEDSAIEAEFSSSSSGISSSPSLVSMSSNQLLLRFITEVLIPLSKNVAYSSSSSCSSSSSSSGSSSSLSAKKNSKKATTIVFNHVEKKPMKVDITMLQKWKEAFYEREQSSFSRKMKKLQKDGVFYHMQEWFKKQNKEHFSLDFVTAMEEFIEAYNKLEKSEMHEKESTGFWALL